MHSFDEIVEMIERELGAVRYGTGRGINGSTLCYMNCGSRQLILQIWEGIGWEIYASSGSIKVDETLEWLKKLEQGKP